MYLYTKTGEQLDMGIGLEMNTTNQQGMSVMMTLSANQHQEDYG